MASRADLIGETGTVSGEAAARAVGHLSLAGYRVTVEAMTRLSLPPYAGSALRGGFGHALKRTVCVSDVPDCNECGLRARCPYPYLFETRLAFGVADHEAVPVPFVFAPPVGDQSDLAPGASFGFDLVLLGPATTHWRYVEEAFHQLGRIGLGKGKGRFRVLRIERWYPDGRGGQVIADHLPGDHRGRRATTGQEIAAAWVGRAASCIAIDFTTPARLRSQGRYVTNAPPFAVLFGRLLDRIAALSYYHHGVPLDIDEAAWKRQAATIGLVESDMRWRDWTRYSNRQERPVDMGGVVGTVVYAGRLEPFLPFLALGEWLHAGKNTTFGLGRYRLTLR